MNRPAISRHSWHQATIPCATCALQATEGVRAWYEQDFIKAAHVLIPQIEIALRGIVSKLGQPVTKKHSTISGISVVIGMGDILYSKEIADVQGADITLHFLTLYVDPRGFNLRNDLAHGLLGANRIGFSLLSRITHTPLIVGIWEELSNRRKLAKTNE